MQMLTSHAVTRAVIYLRIHVHSGATQWVLSLRSIAVPHANTMQRDSNSFPLFIADENNGFP